MLTKSLKTTFLSILMLGMTATSFSQNQQPKPDADPAATALKQTSQMKKSLTLDAAQEKKVYDLNLILAKKRAELKKNQEGNPGNMKEKMAALRTEYDKNLKPILSQEQYAKYLKDKENAEKKPANSSSGQKEKPGLTNQGGAKK